MDIEYIPGDLVFSNGKRCKVVGYSFSDSDLIRVYEYRHGSFDDTVSIVSISQEVHGIPLTPEILEKNGWDKEEKDGNIFSLSEAFLGGDKDDEDNYTHFFIFYNNEKDGWDIDMRGNPLKNEIHYVHELQHLFYGLGINNEMEV